MPKDPLKAHANYVNMLRQETIALAREVSIALDEIRRLHETLEQITSDYGEGFGAGDDPTHAAHSISPVQRVQVISNRILKQIQRLQAMKPLGD
jgi:hypothetical protein